MKIKIVRRFELYLAPEGCEDEVYDIYHGFTGLPHTLPFCTKWDIAQAGLSREETLNYVSKYILDMNPNVIIKL